MEDKKTLVVKYKNVVGNHFFYPGNKNAETMLSMSKSSSGKRKVFTREDLDKLESMGFIVNVLMPKVIYE